MERGGPTLVASVQIKIILKIILDRAAMVI